MERRHPTIGEFPPHIRAMIIQEAAYAGVQLSEVPSWSHRPEPANVRFAVWHRQRTELTCANGNPPSYPRIGKLWRRNHVTIMVGVRRYEELTSGT